MKRVPLALGIALLLATFEPASARKPAKADRYDDPLPEGAIARLGTVRLLQRQGALGVAFSPDGKMLATTGWGEAIHLWELPGGKLIRRFVGSKPVGTFAVAFSRDGRKLAAACEQGLVYLFDVGTGRELFKAQEHEGRTFGIAFAPDGLTFATAGSDGAVRRPPLHDRVLRLSRRDLLDVTLSYVGWMAIGLPRRQILGEQCRRQEQHHQCPQDGSHLRFSTSSAVGSHRLTSRV